MTIFLLVLCLGVGLACGWGLKAHFGNSSDDAADGRDVPPPAVIYEEGYSAGWKAAASARSWATSVSGSGFPRATDAVAPETEPRANPRPAAKAERISGDVAAGRGSTPRPEAEAPTAMSAPAKQLQMSAAPKADASEIGASRDLRNINITLFAASLLLIAATALFIGSDFSPVMRFGVVVSVAALFYVAGLWIYGRMSRLRPAGLAFVGAALAMIPFAGFALNLFVLHHLGWSWVVTAVIGGAAFVNAAVRLRSRVVAYLSLPFMLSIAWAPTSVLGAGLVWYFAATIGAAAVLTVVAKLRPRWAGNLYVQVIREVHGYIVPGVVLLSLLSVSLLEALDYFLISAAASSYYLASLWSTAPSKSVVLNVYGLRVTLFLAAMSSAATLEADAVTVVNVGAFFLALQSVVVVCLPRRLAASFDTHVQAMGSALPPGTFRPAVAKTAPPRGVNGLRGSQIVDVYWTFGIALLMTFLGLAIGSVNGRSATEILMVVLTAGLVAMLLAWRIRRVGELLVPAALVLVLFVPPHALWCFEIIIAAVLAYSVLRAATSPSPSVTRTGYVLVARAQVVFASGLLVADYWPSGGSTRAGHLAIFVVICALVINQFVSMVQLQRKRGLRSPASVIVVSGGLAYVAAVVLLLDFAPALIVTAGLWLALFGLAVPATLLFRHLTWMEAVAPIALASTALFAIPVFDVHGYELLLTASVGYALILTAHHRDAVARTVYGFVAQGLVAGTAAVFTLGHWPEGWGLSALWMALFVLSLGLFVTQLVSLGQLHRGVPETMVGGSTTIYAALATVPVTALVQLDAPLWVAVTALWALLLGTVICGLVLLRQLRWVQIPTGAVFPLIALLGMPVFRVVDYETLLGAGLVYGFTIAALHSSRPVKGAYFLAGQIQLTLLTSVFLWDQKVSMHIFVIVFSLSLLVQELLRTLFRRYTRNLDFQRTSGWLTILLLVAIQAWYLMLAGALAQRGVTVTAFAVLFVVSLVISVWGRKELRYIAVACVPLMLVVFSSVLPFSDDGWLGAAEIPDTATATLATILAVLVLILRNTTVFGQRRMRATTTAAGVFLLEGLLFSTLAGGWAPALVLLIAAIVLLMESHTWNVPQLYALGSIAAISASWCAGAETIRILDLEWDFRELQLVAHCGAAVLIYSWILARWRDRPGRLRHLSAVVPIIAALALGSLFAMTGGDLVVAGSTLLVVAASLAACEVPKIRRELAGEGVFLVSIFAAESIWINLDPMVSTFWLVQIWAVAVALIALYENRRRRPISGRAWMFGAAAILSTSGLLALLTQDSGYQLWALLGHVALLLYGVTRQSRAFTWWGAVGISLAVLWFLRGYTFILLALVAAALIAFALWRLNRSRDPVDA